MIYDQRSGSNTAVMGSPAKQPKPWQAGIKKSILFAFLALFLAGCATGPMYTPAYGQVYAPPPQNLYAAPWVGSNTPWVFYNGDWFLNGMLYYYFGPRYGWAPYYTYAPTYIVRPSSWYAPKWNSWYRAHPAYWNHLVQKYPYRRNHRPGQHYDQRFYETHHRGQGGGWHKGFHGVAPQRPYSERSNMTGPGTYPRGQTMGAGHNAYPERRSLQPGPPAHPQAGTFNAGRQAYPERRNQTPGYATHPEGQRNLGPGRAAPPEARRPGAPGGVPERQAQTTHQGVNNRSHPSKATTPAARRAEPRQHGSASKSGQTKSEKKAPPHRTPPE
jgi:hypothetical protein